MGRTAEGAQKHRAAAKDREAAWGAPGGWETRPGITRWVKYMVGGDAFLPLGTLRSRRPRRGRIPERQNTAELVLWARCALPSPSAWSPCPTGSHSPTPAAHAQEGRHPEWAGSYSFKSLNSHFDKYLTAVPISTRWVNSVPGQRFSTDSCQSDVISTMTRETWGQKQIVVGESESCGERREQARAAGTNLGPPPHRSDRKAGLESPRGPGTEEWGGATPRGVQGAGPHSEELAEPGRGPPAQSGFLTGGGAGKLPRGQESPSRKVPPSLQTVRSPTMATVSVSVETTS